MPRCRGPSRRITRKRAGPAATDCRRRVCCCTVPGDIAIHEFFNRQSVESVPVDKQEEWERHRRDQLELMRRYAYGARLPAAGDHGLFRRRRDIAEGLRAVR